MFSCEFCEISKNTFFTEHPWTTASKQTFLRIFRGLLLSILQSGNSRSHHYAQLGNALQKHFFAYSALIMGTLKGSTGRFFNFSAISQNFTGGSTGLDLP